MERSTLVYNTDASGNPTSTAVTDPLGSIRTYNFTTILGVVKSTGQSQPAGSGCAAAASAISYDANGNVTTRTDFSGHTTSYVYDLTRNLETSRTEGLTSAGVATAATRTTTTTWHAALRLPLTENVYTGATATGTPIKMTTYYYDSHGNLTSLSETDPALSRSRTTSISYTYSTVVPGLVLTKVIDGPRTDVTDITTYTYYPHDATCTPSTASSTVTNLGCRGQLQSLTDALGHITQYTRYNHHGQLEQMTDANGIVTTMTYDARQRLLSRTVAGLTTTFTYDGVGQLIHMSRPDVSYVNYTYDAAHRLTAISDTSGNSVNYTLDSASNIIQTDYRNPDGTTVKHDAFEYDALSRLQTAIDAGNHLTTHAYDPNGNLTKIIDGRNKTTTYTPDTLDRTTTTVNALAGNTQSSYNALDQTILVKAPNNAQTSYVVDALNNVTTENSADRGTTTAAYDNAGNLNTMSDARGVVSTTTWDALNRPLSTSYPQTGENRSYTWDTGTGCSNGIGRLCQMTDSAGTTKFSYDAHGNLLSQTRSEAGSSLTTSFSYDAADRLIATSAPTGQAVTTQRDSNGRIKQMNTTVAGLNTAIVSNIQTDAVGNTTAQTFGNRVSENYTFNLMGYLGSFNSINSNTGGGTGSPASSADNADTPTLPEWAAIIMAALLLALNLRYTGRRTHGLALLLMIGLISAVTMNPLNMQSAYADTALGYDENHNVITRTTPLGTTNYGYDDLNRLNIESGTAASQNIGYDANGNRTSDGTANYTYTPNTDRIATISGQTVTMDAAGNITSAHNLSFAWNQAGQLKTVSQGTGTGATLLATYYYDYQGRRSRKETTSAAPQGVTTTLYVYDQADHLLAEVRPPNTPLATYIWKDDAPVSVIVHSAAYHDANPTFTSPDQAIYLEVDQLNTPRAGRNQAGTVVWSWESDAFGSTAANNDPDGDGKKTVINLRFPGQYFDIESGLHYNHHRYYDPKLGGRYLSSDPIGLAGGMNTYAYVKGNPLSYEDPYGLDTYVTNRDLSALGTSVRSWSDPLTHTFTFSTNPDGSIANTYSWGNSANLQGWNLNQPEDINAAKQALQNGDAQQVAPSFVDPYYRRAFNQLKNPANNHANGVVVNNCKTETVKLNDLAWKLLMKGN